MSSHRKMKRHVACPAALCFSRAQKFFSSDIWAEPGERTVVSRRRNKWDCSQGYLCLGFGSLSLAAPLPFTESFQGCWLQALDVLAVPQQGGEEGGMQKRA